MPLPNVTLKHLKSILDYNSATGFFKWKLSFINGTKIGDIAGSLDDNGYIVIRIDHKIYQAHRLAWFYYHGYWPEHGLDHKDRVKYHNWIDNLREASKQCNARNTGNRSDNLSGVKGVNWNNNVNKWRSKISIMGNSKHLGVFDDFDEAVCHRLAAEQCLDWSNCDSNSPAYQYVLKYIQGIE